MLQEKSGITLQSRLRTARRALSLTQAQLAREWGYSDEYISQIETGSREAPPWLESRVAELEDKIGINPIFLAEGGHGYHTDAEMVADWQHGVRILADLVEREPDIAERLHLLHSLRLTVEKLIATLRQEQGPPPNSGKAPLSTSVLKRAVAKTRREVQARGLLPTTDAPSGKTSPPESGNAPHPDHPPEPPAQAPVAPTSEEET